METSVYCAAVRTSGGMQNCAAVVREAALRPAGLPEAVGGVMMRGVGGCRFGPSSSVILTTTWLDDRVRLGRGSRGSRFVFLRGGYARSAGDLVYWER